MHVKKRPRCETTRRNRTCYQWTGLAAHTLAATTTNNQVLYGLHTHSTFVLLFCCVNSTSHKYLTAACRKYNELSWVTTLAGRRSRGVSYVGSCLTIHHKSLRGRGIRNFLHGLSQTAHGIVIILCLTFGVANLLSDQYDNL